MNRLACEALDRRDLKSQWPDRINLDRGPSTGASMKRTVSRLVPALSLLAAMASCPAAGAFPPAADLSLKGPGPQFRVRFGPEQSTSPLDGRILVMLSKDPAEEPRLQINDSPKTQQIFGIDVEGLKPGQDAVVDATALGYPVESLAERSRRELSGPGPPAPLRDLSQGRRAHRQAADGSRRRDAVEQGPRESLQHAREVTLDPREPAPV